MNAWLGAPLALRFVALAALGAVLGAVVNWIVDRVGWEPTFFSPWHRGLAPGSTRPMAHRAPILGWLLRRHESEVHGAGFWLRPLLVELGLALLLPALYWYETVHGGLLGPAWALAARREAPRVHAEYLSHVVIVVFMLIASLVDLDDKIIPDTVTVPGTLAGLLIAFALPGSLLPDVGAGAAGRIELRAITLASPNEWPPTLDSRWGSALGLACYWIWCLGLMPRVWRTRRGLRAAAGLFWGRLRRDRATYAALAMGLVGSVLIAVAYSRAGDRWPALLTALFGLAVTGGFTWLIRVVATLSIGREALGFGDVTLMSMIGAFLGWQAGLMVFFLAPFFGLLLGLFQWVLRRDPEIPYGPFLCLAAVTVVLRWPILWESTRLLFQTGGLLLAVLLFGVALMGLLLSGWHRLVGR